jgi:hypothetical protein
MNLDLSFQLSISYSYSLLDIIRRTQVQRELYERLGFIESPKNDTAIRAHQSKSQMNFSTKLKLKLYFAL